MSERITLVNPYVIYECPDCGVRVATNSPYSVPDCPDCDLPGVALEFVDLGEFISAESKEEIERLRRERETLAEAVRAMKYFFDSDYSDPEESATLNWSYAYQKWLEALDLLEGGGGA